MKLRYLLLLLLLSVSCFGISTVKAQQKPTPVFKTDFKKSYNTRKFDYQGEPVVRQTHLQNQKSQGYSSEVEPKFNEKKENTGLNSTWPIFIKWGLIIVLVCAILFLVYNLIQNGGTRLFGSRGQKRLKNSKKLSADELAETDFNTLIRSAEKEKDYRLALRFQYLLVLKILDNKGFIVYKEDLTNEDYLNAITSQNIKTKFEYASYVYSYTWYGTFDVDSLQYERTKLQFDDLTKAILS